MVRIDDDYNIEITRGDVLPLKLKVKNKDGSYYTFVKDDKVRFKIIEKKNTSNVIYYQDVVVEEDTQEVIIVVSAESMKIGDLINKPMTYWYEIELNPDTNDTHTVIGYTLEKGAKRLILTPEGADINA